MNKYIIIAALSLCNSTWTMDTTTKKVDSWEPTIKDLVDIHEQQQLRNKKYKVLDFLNYATRQPANSPLYRTNQSNLFVISRAKL